MPVNWSIIVTTVKGIMSKAFSTFGTCTNLKFTKIGTAARCEWPPIVGFFFVFALVDKKFGLASPTLDLHFRISESISRPLMRFRDTNGNPSAFTLGTTKRKYDLVSHSVRFRRLQYWERWEHNSLTRWRCWNHNHCATPATFSALPRFLHCDSKLRSTFPTGNLYNRPPPILRHLPPRRSSSKYRNGAPASFLCPSLPKQAASPFRPVGLRLPIPRTDAWSQYQTVAAEATGANSSTTLCASSSSTWEASRISNPASRPSGP